MSALSPSQIFALNRKAGFDVASATIATAIALAESGGRPNAIGDIDNPGPGAKSVGLFQINYLPSRDAKVPWRDPQGNLNPFTNAQNAFKISNNGKNFGPWATFTSGSYKSHLGAASKAAKSATAIATASPAAKESGGFDWGAASIWGPLPAWIADVTGKKLPAPVHASTGEVAAAVKNFNPLGGVAKIITQALLVLAGLGLVVLGLARATGVEKVATKAATKGSLE